MIFQICHLNPPSRAIPPALFSAHMSAKMYRSITFQQISLFCMQENQRHYCFPSLQMCNSVSSRISGELICLQGWSPGVRVFLMPLFPLIGIWRVIFSHLIQGLGKITEKLHVRKLLICKCAELFCPFQRTVLSSLRLSLRKERSVLNVIRTSV